MISIAIVDDESIFADSFEKVISDYMAEAGMEINISKFQNAEELLKMDDGFCDFGLYFLDIEMKQMDGMELAKIIRKKCGLKPDIIFVTSREMAVFDAFSVDALGFVRKNYLMSDFDRAMKKYEEKIKRREHKYEFCAEDRFIYKSEDEILFAEVYGHCMYLHCTDGSYKMRGTINELAKRIPSENFLEPYRGYLVNCHYIDHIEKDVLILDNGGRIPLSKRKREEVRKKFLRYLS